MEDWGLISFAESALLFDPATSGTQTRRRIFSIVAHEVAHQWFGNLVTAASWEEIWLNEAFATWLAEKATDRFNPDWQVPLRRRLDIENAMARDASTATRAIRSGPVPEDRVFDVFDGITYAKGGAVLTMLERWIGPEVFRRGLGEYMQARRLSNATAGDLWFHIGKASVRDVSSVATSWTDQPGFPLVTVATRCLGDQTQVELTQQRFTTSGAAGPALWQIPVVLSHGGTSSTVLMDKATRSLVLPGCPPQPMLVNPDGDGFYRVAYEPAQHAALTAIYPALPAAAQVALLSDTFALAQAGRLPMAAYLDLLVALPQVQGPGRAALFAQARAGLDFLARSLAGTPAAAPLFAAARALLAPELGAVGWLPRAGEDSETEALRSSLIRQLARFDDPETIVRARALFDADEAGRAPLPAAIRAAVVNATGRHADAPRFAQLMARLKQAQSEEDRWLFAGAIAGTRDPALAGQVMELSLQSELPNNVAPWLPGMVSDQPAHAAAAYAFVVDHWGQLAEKAGDMFGARAWLLPAASESFNDPAAAQRLLADQQRLAGGSGAAPASQVAAQIELRSVIRARESERLGKALEAMPGRMRAGL
jgi:aminopeptidase N